MLRILGWVAMLLGALALTACNRTADAKAGRTPIAALPQEYLGEWEVDGEQTKAIAKAEMLKDTGDMPGQLQQLARQAADMMPSYEGTRVTIEANKVTMSTTSPVPTTSTLTITQWLKTPTGQILGRGTTVNTMAGEEYPGKGSIWMRRQGDTIRLVESVDEEDAESEEEEYEGGEPDDSDLPMVLVRAKAAP